MTVTSRTESTGSLRVPRRVWAGLLSFALLGLQSGGAVRAQDAPSTATASALPAARTANPVPSDYRIGAGDVLAIRFWRLNDVSADVVVRPDGKVSLLLLDDVQAAGLTPEQLRDGIQKAAADLFESPRVTVVVKEINSRNVYITGMVAKPGPYPLNGGLRVLQLIAMAGGLLEFANANDIVIMRSKDGQQIPFRFSYEDVRQMRRDRLDQNIALEPGDTVIVP